jgi:cell division protein FtsQ
MARRSDTKAEAQRPRRLLSRLFGGRKNRRLRRPSSDQMEPAAPESGSGKAADERPAASRGDDRRRARAELRRKRLRERSLGALRTAGRGLATTAKLLAVLGLLAAAGLGGYHGYQRMERSSYFHVDTVHVTGTRHALPSELKARIAGVKGRSIFDLDLDAVAQALQRHPWVKRAKVLRQLPRTLRVEVVEHRVQAAILVRSFYLVSKDGRVFKRAELAEAEGLPLITGIERKELIARPQRAQARIKVALSALTAYQRQVRPPLSEVHLGRGDAVTFFLRRSGTALRFGTRFDEGRLRQLDAIWAALGASAVRARALYFDHEVRGDRVVVRMAGGPGI